jgi:hypothetical protein
MCPNLGKCPFSGRRFDSRVLGLGREFVFVDLELLNLPIQG